MLNLILNSSYKVHEKSSSSLNLSSHERLDKELKLRFKSERNMYVDDTWYWLCMHASMKFSNEFTYSVKAMVLLPIVRKALDGVQELKITMS